MTIEISTRTFRMADLGQESPLPMVESPLENPAELIGADGVSDSLPREIIDGARYGNPRNLFPYTQQNGYSRTLTTRSVRTVVLQNNRLRACFLPELGGRLWELTDLATGTGLLHSPDTIQLANLALRNAWFAGGIEFNIGSRGHSPTTCSPLHTAIVRTAEGTELLRMWEFDRLRRVVFQIDAWLPEDSAVLFLAVRIRNPNGHVVPMYWWSNAAVPQDADSRVIAPARSAFVTAYDGGLSRLDPTDDAGIDGTWPSRPPQARDYFFDIDRRGPTGRRPWIVNADRNGDGLAMISSSRLYGRKLFVWGGSAGGESWQRWLSPDGEHYAEIQAGLAQTQFQNLPMPAASEWSSVEAYGNARVDTALAHGDRDAAIGHVQGRVDALLGQDELDAAVAAAQRWADCVPHTRILSGSGWGALEARLRGHDGLAWIDEAGTPFDADTLTAAQTPWLALLESAGDRTPDVEGAFRFPGADSFVTGSGWEARLAAEPHNPHSLAHRAVMAHARGDEQARRLYLEVIAERDRALSDESARRGADTADAPDAPASPDAPAPVDAPAIPDALAALAHRGLALLACADGGGTATAVDHYVRACALDPHNRNLLVEAVTAALAADAPQTAIRLLDAAGEENPDGRLRYLRARAAAAIGRRDDAAALLSAGIEVADLREGDDPLTELWRQVFPATPVPRHYRFSMHEDPPV